MAKAAPIDYQALSSELDSIMVNLQQDDIDVDEALKLYERGLDVVQQLETYLAKAEHTVSVLKARRTDTA